MFRSPEHALHVAYNISALPIEAKNATQLIIEMLRERFDVTYERKAFSGLSPHDWHAQAAMTQGMTERVLINHPTLMASIRTEYSTGLELAMAAQLLSNHFRPNISSSERFAFDYLVVHLYRKNPSLREIQKHFGVSKSTLCDWVQVTKPQVSSLRQKVVDVLAVPMSECGLVSFETTY